MNSRIKKLRSILFDTDPRICSERCNIFTKAMKESEGMPIAIRRANAFYDVLDQMTVKVTDGELIVGNQASEKKASPIYPEYSYQWLLDEFEGKPYYFDKRPGDKFFYDEKTKEDILASIDYWKGKTTFENLRKTLPDNCRIAWDIGAIDDTWVSSAGLGNIVVDYNMVLQKGLVYFMQKIRDKIASLDLTQPGEVKKLWFLQAALKGNEAVVNFSNRIAKKCVEMAKEATDIKQKEEYMQLAQICERVPYQPATTFHEAVQSIWLILLAVHLESNGHAFSLGRFDQYVYPFYKSDLEKGRIDKDKALEIIEAFYIKCNELNKLRSWPDTAFFLGYQMFVNLTVGGQTVDGKDATNDISYMCVEACRELKLFTPSVSIKWFEGTPDRLLNESLKAVNEHMGGQPAFYNDKAFFRILEEMGIAKDDLCEWSPVGCIEASIPGKWDYAAKGPWLSVLKILEITLHNGKDPATGAILLPTTRDISECTSMDVLFEEFKRQLKYYMQLQVVTEHINDEIHIQSDINAFRASLVHDCIERGKDLIEGGSIYSADGGPTAGTISTGDALAAIDQLVFQSKALTLKQIVHAMQTNFEDNTTAPEGAWILQMMRNKMPKFGNDDDAADQWSVKVADFIGSTYRREFKNSRYGKGPIPASYSYSQSPVTGNIAFGKSVGATPDGRKAGEPVNNGISPANGSEKQGATAAVNSVAKMPSIWFQKGAIFNMRLTHSALSSEENRQKVIAMIKVLFENYGEHIQFNVVDNEVLKDAMKKPEDYKDLMVRVSGYSALFTSLDPEVQIDVIKRTEFEI